MPYEPFLLLFLKRVADILKGVGFFESVEDAVEVAAERAIEGLGVHGRGDRAPGSPVADGRRPASVVRHAGDLEINKKC